MSYANTSLRARRAPRKAVTLIEMLVAIAATLVLMTAVTQVMDMLGGSMADNRAAIEQMDQLRTVRLKLQADLAGHTAQALPWQNAESGSGYFEVVEGTDTTLQDRLSGWPNGDNRFGDRDDVIALTVRSQGPAFTSTDGNNDEESHVAEVVWYLMRDQNAALDQPLYTLYRHVELVGASGAAAGNTAEGALGELTKRENRWPRGSRPLQANSLPTNRDDIVLRNVLSFDVKVWDPQAPIYANSSNQKRVMAPGDPVYNAGGTVIGRGAYVDLGYLQESNTSTSPTSHFSALPKQSISTFRWPSPTWDTWSRFYERDGVDGDPGYDGFDNDGINGVDDPGERETRPPYDHPLRGIRVTIRIYEPASQLVRQISVVQHFMPE
jgi:hypothetical protein